MGLASLRGYGLLLACIVVSVTAPNPAIGQQNTLERGAELDDGKPQQQLRKLLQRYNINGPIEHISYAAEQADTMRRRLVQFINDQSPVAESPSSTKPPSRNNNTAGAPGPAPGPQAEMSPAPAPYNPFVPANNGSNLACCCRSTFLIFFF
jgi:hypothetical protein